MTPAACDWTKGVGKLMHDKFAEQSLCGDNATWQPGTKTEYYVMHSATDTYMDWHVSQQMADYLKKKGCHVVTDFADSGDHISYGAPIFYLTAAVLLEGDNREENQNIVDLLQELANFAIDVQAHPEKYTDLVAIFPK